MLRVLACLLLLSVPAGARGGSLLRQAADHLRAPFTRSGATLVGLGLGTSLLTEDLEQPEQEVSFLEWTPLESVSDVGNVFGGGEFALAAALSTWTLGLATGHEPLGAFGRDLTATFLATGAWVWALKATINEPRPNGAPYSFPSGHTAVAFATATTVHRHFGGVAGFLGYTAATMTAAARMEDNRHYFRDVSFGAALGMAVAGARVPFGRWFRGFGVNPQGVSYELKF